MMLNWAVPGGWQAVDERQHYVDHSDLPPHPPAQLQEQHQTRRCRLCTSTTAGYSSASPPAPCENASQSDSTGKS